MSSAIINGKEIGQEIRGAVATRVEALKAKGVTYRLSRYFSRGKPSFENIRSKQAKILRANWYVLRIN